MSKKDFDKYYDSIEKDYFELLSLLKDTQKEFEDGLVSPDAVEKIQQIVEPVKRNYETISYIRFILNLPVKKHKRERFKNANKKHLKNMRTEEAIKEENKQSLQRLKNLFSK